MLAPWTYCLHVHCKKGNFLVTIRTEQFQKQLQAEMSHLNLKFEIF